jgi:mono/diheme cytochrome c family protein
MSSFGHRLAALSIGLTMSVAAGPTHAETSAQPNAAIERGKYLAVAADCAACHTAPNRLPFAGGLPIEIPLGTIYSTNITPSADLGIGRYTEEQFSRALRRGIRGDGAHLYPAMPYTSYAKFTDDDTHALYLYFTRAVAPVEARAPETELPFPMNIRLSMLAWNILFLDRQVFTPDPKQSSQWNRGAYLVEGPAHCSTCHTPRGFLMQEETSHALSGAQVGPWYAPNITSDPASGIGSWSKEDLAAYLRSGHLRGKAQAAGSMGEAVEHSFQHLSADDIDAIARYIKSVPAITDSAISPSRFTLGKMFSELAVLRGQDGVKSDDSSPTGAALFLGNCVSCHAAEGQGSKDGYYPSLFHNSATGAKNPTNLIATILYGVDRSVSGRQAFMPGFGGRPTDANQLSDHNIAMLANYVLAHYGSGDATVSEQEVNEIRRGGPSSSLLLLTRAGIGAAVIIVLGAAFIIYGSKRKPRFSRGQPGSSSGS